LVSKIVVNSVNAELHSWRRANVLEKSLEPFSVWGVFMPCSTHTNSTAAIVLESFMPGIIASHMHHVPDTIFTVEMRFDGLDKATAMSLGIRFAQKVVFGECQALLADTLNPPPLLEVRTSGL
jgi:hypothetical protein